mmetsp:Transcript_18392/g.46049  ORF Transcript_18392/g.46049 Transcript_18392/m.46049 type:complete len:477 (+) Transcript_18392:443-1873(+)
MVDATGMETSSWAMACFCRSSFGPTGKEAALLSKSSRVLSEEQRAAAPQCSCARDRRSDKAEVRRASLKEEHATCAMVSAADELADAAALLMSPCSVNTSAGSSRELWATIVAQSCAETLKAPTLTRSSCERIIAGSGCRPSSPRSKSWAAPTAEAAAPRKSTSAAECSPAAAVRKGHSRETICSSFNNRSTAASPPASSRLPRQWSAAGRCSATIASSSASQSTRRQSSATIPPARSHSNPAALSARAPKISMRLRRTRGSPCRHSSSTGARSSSSTQSPSCASPFDARAHSRLAARRAIGSAARRSVCVREATVSSERRRRRGPTPASATAAKNAAALSETRSAGSWIAAAIFGRTGRRCGRSVAARRRSWSIVYDRTRSSGCSTPRSRKGSVLGARSAARPSSPSKARRTIEVICGETSRVAASMAAKRRGSLDVRSSSSVALESCCSSSSGGGGGSAGGGRKSPSESIAAVS